MRFPWKYVQVNGQWFTENEHGNRRPAEPEVSLDVLVGDEWQMGSIGPDENGKWIVRSNFSRHSWELKEGQWAFYCPGPYDWVHPMCPRGKCVCEVYRLEETLFNEEYIGAIIMDLADFPFKRSLWIDNGIYIRLSNGYYIDIDFKRSSNMLGYDEDVFFWSE